jgi:hypothetical protein
MTTGRTLAVTTSIERGGTGVTCATRTSGNWNWMPSADARTAGDTDPRLPLVIEQTTAYRGNRVISHFYPEQYAKVLYAKWAASRFGGE